MKFYLFSIFLSFTAFSYAQTPKQVSTFPESYVGKTITFKNIAYLPSLHESEGLYLVGIDIANRNPEAEFGFGSLDKITAAVPKSIAKQMIDKDISGYGTLYYGSVTGTVVKRSLSWTSKYVFLISKIVNHRLYEDDKPIETFKIK